MFFNTSINASERFRFYMDGSLTESSASHEEFVFEMPEEHPANADVNFENMPGYSDLDYRMLSLTYGASFQIDRDSRLYGSITVMDLDDGQPYVYGDLDGKLTIYSAGMTVDF